MSIVKRFNRLLGLEKIDVLVDEKDKSRHIIISDMPESLPQGKSSFLIEVSPYMRKGIELQIDFIDAKGNSIYVEPVSNYLEGTSRTVSVEVYNTVAPGVATMIIVGELEGLPINAGNFSDTEQIPDEFKGVYNVRLTKEVIINPAEINIQPIKFYSSPRLTAVEKRFGSMEREVVSGETTSSAFSIIGTPTQQEPFSVFTPSESEVDALGGGVKEIDETPKPPDGDIKGDEADKERLKRFSKKRSVRSDSRFKRSKRIRRRLYEKIDENTIKIHNLEKRLEVSSPKNLIVKRYENLKILKMNLSKYFKQIIDNKRYKYEIFRTSIINLNPLNIMKKGYSIVNQNNKLLKSVKKVEIGNNLDITMYDGKLEAKVLSKEVKNYEE